MNIVATGRVAKRWRPYAAYKDSGVEWLGEVPEGWQVKRLKYTAKIVAGQSPPSEDVSAGADGLPFLQGNAEFGQLHPNPRLVCDLAPKKAQEGDILLSVRAPVGALNIADQVLGIGRGLCAIQTREILKRNFAFYLLMTMRKNLDAVAKGSTYDAVTASEVGDLPVLHPPLLEQRAIAAFLDHETAKTDALVVKEDRHIELLQEKRTALISHAVTKGLNPAAPMKDSGVEWLGEVPEGWEILCLKYIAHTRAGSAITAASLDEEGVYPVYGGNGLRGYTSAFTHEGDYVLIGRQGALCGNVNYVNGRFWASEHAVVVTPLGSTNVNWLGRLLQSMDLNRYSLAAAQPGLAVDNIKMLQVARPSLSEQRSIAVFLDREMAKIDALINKIQEHIEKLREHRTALITAAVTGKIDVTNWSKRGDTDRLMDAVEKERCG